MDIVLTVEIESNLQKLANKIVQESSLSKINLQQDLKISNIIQSKSIHAYIKTLIQVNKSSYLGITTKADDKSTNEIK